MDEYRPADLSTDALAAIRRLERELGVTLVAFQPAPAEGPKTEPRHPSR